MSNVTAIMQAKLDMATDPDEIAARQRVLDDHVAGQEHIAKLIVEARGEDRPEKPKRAKK